VSVSSTGHQANGASFLGAMSPDGRYVVFNSEATNLVQGDTNGKRDVFVRDRQRRTTERVSVSSTGAQGNNDSFGAGISTDGRYVAFTSLASNLVPGDTNGRPDVFVHDRQTGETVQASLTAGGAQTLEGGGLAFLSNDGRFVLFASRGNKYVSGDTNRANDTFVRDLRAGTTERVSVSSGGAQGDGDSFGGGISANGRYAVFDSAATTLARGDTNDREDVFERDRKAHTTTRVSVSSDGAQGNDDSFGGGISANGRYAVFWSSATNLVPEDTNGQTDVFVRDLKAGTTERVSVGQGGAQGNLGSIPCCGQVISADGRYVAFRSDATNLVIGIVAEHNIYVRDRVAGVTTLESVASDGTPANNNSGYPAEISADGRLLAFDSDATNLVPGDTNGQLCRGCGTDVFVRTR
jgi:Tol biopolymer transport system component